MANSIELKKECLIALLQHHCNIIEPILFKLHANGAKKEEQEKKLEKKLY